MKRLMVMIIACSLALKAGKDQSKPDIHIVVALHCSGQVSQDEEKYYVGDDGKYIRKFIDKKAVPNGHEISIEKVTIKGLEALITYTAIMDEGKELPTLFTGTAKVPFDSSVEATIVRDEKSALSYAVRNEYSKVPSVRKKRSLKKLPKPSHLMALGTQKIITASARIISADDN